MKIEFSEFENGINFTITPESVEETAQLLRFANNAKAEKPQVWMNFSQSPVAYISLQKVKKSVQKNSIGNS